MSANKSRIVRATCGDDVMVFLSRPETKRILVGVRTIWQGMFLGRLRDICFFFKHSQMYWPGQSVDCYCQCTLQCHCPAFDISRYPEHGTSTWHMSTDTSILCFCNFLSFFNCFLFVFVFFSPDHICIGCHFLFSPPFLTGGGGGGGLLFLCRLPAYI